MDTLESYQWVVQHTAESPEGRSMDKLEGFEELLKTVIARTPIALRLAGLKAEEQILALSDDVLATLPQSYIATLPAEARAEIERRLSTRH